mgnify:CR=1 FL=1
MATTLHSFIDIFDFQYKVDEELVTLSKIIIPIIQRDYAQGRTSDDVNRKRERFLEALKDAVTIKPITLDFVYGDISKDGVMTPLDGQQRLTTLFLLYWYAAKKNKVEASKYSFLNKFSYETRYSARDFCHFLIDFAPEFNCKISDEIIEQNWFPLDWKKDPTINSMLVMLDSIDEKFNDIPNLWDKLCNKAITFYFLPIKDMGLTDELYIKMNSRGKPLTDFEHFKAEFEREIKKQDDAYANSIINKIDIDWTDMLWTYRGEDNVIDDEFLRYFNFICDIICYKNGNSPLGKSSNEFDLLKEYFTGEKDKVLENIQLLEKYFDCWCKIPNQQNIKEFFESFISREHEENKIMLDSRNETDLFEACLRSFGTKKQFTLAKLVLLYSVIAYLLNQERITFEQFKRRFRIINNLVRNSDDEIHNDENRDGGNRLPAILKQIDSIIIEGKISTEFSPNFNLNQLNEEIEKDKWVNENEKETEKLYALEDHTILHGQISILGLEHIDLAERFSTLFNCNWDKVDCALLAINNYRQQNLNKWRYQMGSCENPLAWEALFHKSKSQGYDNTKNVLVTLLSKTDDINDDLLTSIAETYLKKCEDKKIFEWRYYYIKYPEFRPGRYGKYYIKQYRDEPGIIKNYELVAMWSAEAVSSLAWSPFLKAIDTTTLSKDDCGMKLVSNEYYVVCLEAGYFVFKKGEEKPVEIFAPVQNEEGIDTENRIEKFREPLMKYLR